MLAIQDVFNTPYISPKFAVRFNSKSAMGIPLIADQVRIGALILGYKETHVFTPEEVTLVEQSLNQFVLAIL